MSETDILNQLKLRWFITRSQYYKKYLIKFLRQKKNDTRQNQESVRRNRRAWVNMWIKMTVYYKICSKNRSKNISQMWQQKQEKKLTESFIEKFLHLSGYSKSINLRYTVIRDYFIIPIITTTRMILKGITYANKEGKMKW